MWRETTNYNIYNINNIKNNTHQNEEKTHNNNE